MGLLGTGRYPAEAAIANEQARGRRLVTWGALLLATFITVGLRPTMPLRKASTIALLATLIALALTWRHLGQL